MSHPGPAAASLDRQAPQERAAPRLAPGSTATPASVQAPSRARGWAELAAVGLAVAVVAALRCKLVDAGPDLDGDSVGHALIGRRFLETPRDIGIHWVWLPLWHLVHALAARLGGGLELVRRWNVVLSASPPFLLYATLRARLARPPAPAPAWLATVEAWVPPVAACVLALWPLEINLGESGQPEILFQTLVLLACLAWERGSGTNDGSARFSRTPRAGLARGPLAGLALAAAALLRYEAWLLPPVMLALWASERPRRARDALAWALPGLAIVAWCALHRALTGEWLQFIRLNREYVAEALVKLHPAWRDGHSGLYTLGYYAAVVPFRSVGWLLLFALPGAGWYARRAPRSHALVLLALLAFVTYGWVRRQHLGLARHFVALIPFYATMLAAGALCTAAWVAARLRGGARGAPASGVPEPTATAPAAAALLVTALVAFHVRPAARAFARLHGRAFASERAAAAVLARADSGGEAVFCDVSRLEVYSNLPHARFVRDPAATLTPARVRAAAAPGSAALVASVPARVSALRPVAEVLFEDANAVVLRVPAAPAGP